MQIVHSFSTVITEEAQENQLSSITPVDKFIQANFQANQRTHAQFNQMLVAFEEHKKKMQLVHQELNHKVIELTNQLAKSERYCRELQTIHQTKEEAYEERIRILEEQLKKANESWEQTENKLKNKEEKLNKTEECLRNFYDGIPPRLVGMQKITPFIIKLLSIINEP